MRNDKFKSLIIILAVSVGFVACEADDSKKEWGDTYIYMPQASMANGGIDNNYPVPLNNNPSTKNYHIDEATNTLNIVLGVYRSGLQKLEAFSVKINVDLEATNSAIPDISRSIMLPMDVYSLPTQVSVADGQRENTFYLSVDLNKLIEKYPNYNNNRLVLVVGISDPTKYELNPKLAKTTVIINASEFMPTVSIVKGGDFETGSESHWTIMNLEAGGKFDDSVAKIDNGHLTMTFGSDPVNGVTGSVALYQPIELEAGKQYVLSSDFYASGEASSNAGTLFFMCISQNEPQENVNYDQTQGLFAFIDSWAGSGLQNQITGKYPQVSTWQGGIDRDSGEFTAGFTGTGYLIIVMGAWGPYNSGTIIIDNVKIDEK